MSEAERKAWAELDRLTTGSPARNWKWSIPANPERDSDLLLAAGLTEVAAERDAAFAVISEVRAEVDAFRSMVNEHLLTPDSQATADLMVRGLDPILAQLPTDTLAAAHTTDLREQSKHYAVKAMNSDDGRDE